jgi:hypothetical protein
MPGRTERRMTSQTPKRERMGRPSKASAFRGRAVQEGIGRASTRRRTRPASRDPARKRSRPARGGGARPRDRAGSGQGKRKN